MLNRGRFRLFAFSATEYSARRVGLMGRATVLDMLSPLTLNFPVADQVGREPGVHDRRRVPEVPRIGDQRLSHRRRPRRAERVRADVAVLRRMERVHRRQRRARSCASTARATCDRVKRSGKVGVILGLQNSEQFRTPKDVDLFYGLGQRISQLTYNSRNMHRQRLDRTPRRGNQRLRGRDHRTDERRRHGGGRVPLRRQARRSMRSSSPSSRCS